VDYLYSLYDSLVGINVPNDKARAVVDAMERDMSTTIATKADLQLLRQEMATKADVASVRQEYALLRKDLEFMSSGFRRDLAVNSSGFQKDLNAMSSGLRKDMDTLASSLGKDMDTLASSLRNEMAVLAAGLRKDMELLSTTMTVRLGSMLVVGFGVMIAVLKFPLG
jgi:hypothetical protein